MSTLLINHQIKFQSVFFPGMSIIAHSGWWRETRIIPVLLRAYTCTRIPRALERRGCAKSSVSTASNSPIMKWTIKDMCVMPINSSLSLQKHLTFNHLNNMHFYNNVNHNLIILYFLLIQIILQSMHKYKPRVHVILHDQRMDLFQIPSLPAEGVYTFSFQETEFTTVTAYQNQQV